MTLSHFASRAEAQAAQQQLTMSWWPNDNQLKFRVDEVYLMHRRGDTGGGQFVRIVSIPLGEHNSKRPTQLMQGPFRQMPTEEYDWVKEARTIMKQRRNRRGRQEQRGRRGYTRQQRSSSPRVEDTPEVIAAKRAERKAKREAIEALGEQQQQ